MPLPTQLLLVSLSIAFDRHNADTRKAEGIVACEEAAKQGEQAEAGEQNWDQDQPFQQGGGQQNNNYMDCSLCQGMFPGSAFSDSLLTIYFRRRR